MTNVYKAYDRVHLDHRERAKYLHNQLDLLFAKSRIIESDLLRQLKPTIALSIKWRFDLLAKTFESPFELERDVQYWIDIMQALNLLGDCGWYNKDDSNKKIDPWERTAEGFDLGWTTTTQGKNFQISKQIAKDRLAQIYDLLGGASFFSGKAILDSGCGPGRYVDELSNQNPSRIVALDQGVRLIGDLKKRFSRDDRVKVVKGTCEDLSCFPSSSFDIVISNGVIHHAKSDLRKMLNDHARVLRPGGVMFIMLIGKGGLELKIWKFIRDFLNDIPLEVMIKIFGSRMSPLRLQGIVDHMYGEYQETDRSEFESWCEGQFSKIQRVPGIAGLDITPEIYHDDPYFETRFGCGQLRYLLFK
ncbi:MAG: class I SAM-dependent methyltransferase [Verrucomicrobiota bacterium]|nr:class I SAM-dependent methyltransferase [Verrucomicrobiota bacterium]